MSPTKDIFGNPIQQTTKKYKPMSFEQKLREAKAKQKYKEFQAKQRAEKIRLLKSNMQRSRQGLAKIKQKAKALKNRATSERLPTLRDKLRGSIYKKE